MQKQAISLASFVLIIMAAMGAVAMLFYYQAERPDAADSLTDTQQITTDSLMARANTAATEGDTEQAISLYAQAKDLATMTGDENAAATADANVSTLQAIIDAETNVVEGEVSDEN